MDPLDANLLLPRNRSSRRKNGNLLPAGFEQLWKKKKTIASVSTDGIHTRSVTDRYQCFRCWREVYRMKLSLPPSHDPWIHWTLIYFRQETGRLEESTEICYRQISNNIEGKKQYLQPVRVFDNPIDKESNRSISLTHFRIIERHSVTALFTVPTVLRVLRKADPETLLGSKYSTKSWVSTFSRSVSRYYRECHLSHLKCDFFFTFVYRTVWSAFSSPDWKRYSWPGREPSLVIIQNDIFHILNVKFFVHLSQYLICIFLKRLKTVFMAGEHCDYEAKAWAESVFHVPILNHWWQTETGHAITATCLGLGHSTSPPKYSTGMPFPGYNRESNFSLAEIYIYIYILLYKIASLV